MQWNKVLLTSSLLVILLCSSDEVSSQDAAFELPVQLVGFPVIILSVRLTNFLKKLTYSLSPATYRSRNRRQLAYADIDPFDAAEVEKYVVGEFGARACVFERVCAHYAARAQSDPKPQMDWSDVFSHYKRSPDQAKDFYLLSVFLGDIVGSPQLCHQLAKRRSCDEGLLEGGASLKTITEPPYIIKKNDKEITMMISSGGNLGEIEKDPYRIGVLGWCVELLTEISNFTDNKLRMLSSSLE